MTSEPSWTGPFTGLGLRQFNKLIPALRREGTDPVRKSRPWSLPLQDRVLLVAAYQHTNLTLRQLLPAVRHLQADGVTGSSIASGRLSPSSPGWRYRKDIVLIVDGTLVPTHDRVVAASSKNHRHSTNHQAVIDASTRFVVAVGKPLPDNRNDCQA